LHGLKTVKIDFITGKQMHFINLHDSIDPKAPYFFHTPFSKQMSAHTLLMQSTT